MVLIRQKRSASQQDIDMCHYPYLATPRKEGLREVPQPRPPPPLPPYESHENRSARAKKLQRKRDAGKGLAPVTRVTPPENPGRHRTTQLIRMAHASDRSAHPTIQRTRGPSYATRPSRTRLTDQALLIPQHTKSLRVSVVSSSLLMLLLLLLQS